MLIEDMTRAEINDVLNNPFMGWAPWAEFGPYILPHRLVHAQIKWSELEPTKGNFDWNGIETKFKFNFWNERKVKIVIRILMDLPGGSTHKDIPEWLYQEINREGTWYGSGFSPNYRNSALIANHERMITALAQRYNNDPRVAFLQLGSLGHWGEFHTVNVTPGSQGYLPEPAVTDQYVRHYLRVFTNKIIMIRRPFQIAKDNNIGLYNDMFGDPTETQRFIRYFTSGYSNNGSWGVAAGTYPAMPDFWRTTVSAGEFANGRKLGYVQDSNIQQTIQYVLDCHTSYLGPCCPAGETSASAIAAVQGNINSMHNRMGYRFVLQSANYSSSVNAGGTLNVTMQWNNKGVAPFYYRWPLELSLADSNNNIAAKVNTPEDIRTWLPGIKSITHGINIPQNLAAGTYTLCVAILDPDTNTPGVEFAMTGKRSDGRYVIGQLTVSSSVPVNPPVISSIAAASVTTSSAVINWSTDRASNSQVEYGTTTAYGTSTPLDSAMVTAHSVSLTGLQPSTTYNYRVKSSDPQGRTSTSGNNTFTTAALPVPAPVTIDGNASDWSNIAAAAVPASIKNLKVTNDASKLYISIEGTGLNVRSSIFINTDNSVTTGYKVAGWEDSGCEYLLENDILQRYTGSGSDWSWSPIGTMEFAKNNTVIEAAIPLTSLQITTAGTVRVGYILNGSESLRLPSPGQPLASYKLKS